MLRHLPCGALGVALCLPVLAADHSDQVVNEFARLDFQLEQLGKVADSLQHNLQGKAIDVKWTVEGEETTMHFNGKSSQISVPEHECLSGMNTLCVQAKVKFDADALAKPIQPIVYKWMTYRKRRGSFALAVYKGSPYCLLLTENGNTEIHCSDLRVEPNRWHTIALIYDGYKLTARLNGKTSDKSALITGKVLASPEPMVMGMATDKEGKPLSFMKGQLAHLVLGTPVMPEFNAVIPGGKVQTNLVARLLDKKIAEMMSLKVDEKSECSIKLDLLETAADASINMTLTGPQGDDSAEVLDRSFRADSSPEWSGRLDPGVYELKLSAPARIVYQLEVDGFSDAYQEQFHTTDRGAGSLGTYFCWFAGTPRKSPTFSIFDCSEGCRLLVRPEQGTVHAIIQTGGVMGDSSAKQGGLGIWRTHKYPLGMPSFGTWFAYPADVNASGDYAIKINGTLHWRRPPAEIVKMFEGSPAMYIRDLEFRAGETTDAKRRRRYEQTLADTFKFMERLTEERPNNHCRIFERYLIYPQKPNKYWGNDGQMLCARTYFQSYMATGNKTHKRYALGIARRSTSLQNLNAEHWRYGALPYGTMGAGENVTWGTSNNIQGKILWGLAELASWCKEKDLLEALRLNADYYARIQYDNGRWAHYADRAPDSRCGYPTCWGVGGLLIAYETLGDEKYLKAAEKALAAYVKAHTEPEGLQEDGSIVCHCTHGNPLEDNHRIRCALTMMIPFARAYKITKKPDYRNVLDGLHRFLSTKLRKDGTFREDGIDCICTIYSQNWAPHACAEAYEATGDNKFLDMGLASADMFVNYQVVSDNPNYHGAWPGSINVVKEMPGGDIDDEGNAYDLYTSWGTGPIAYGIRRLLQHIE